MKKIIFLFLLLCTLLGGCSSDKTYIDTLKKVPTENILESKTTEELAVNFIKVITKSEDVNPSKLKWEVEGNTKNGKVVIAEYNQNKVYFNTTENGDYVEYVPLEVYMITSENEKISLAEAMYSNLLDDFAKAFKFQ